MKPFKFNSSLLATAISAVLLVGCNDNDHDAPASAASAPTPIIKTTSRTVLVYMVGSDLESKGGAATADINEMLKVGSTENLNIVITTGGAEKDGWKTVKRYLLPKGTKTITSIKELTALADLGDKNMGDTATLRDFLDWGIKNYSADKYSLVFWDHGGGAVGGNGTVGNDETKGGDALSLPEIKQAINNVTTLYKTKFDFIGFDTCLMATIETANMLIPYADYMVASEELEPGTGWDYSAWLSAIKNNPAISTLDISKKIIDSYYASFNSNPDEQKTVTLSSIQLNKMAALTTALDNLAQKAGNNLNSTPDVTRIEMGQGREKSESYGQQANDDSGMIDLGDFVSKLSATYSTEANNVKTAISNAVAYNKRGSAKPKAQGLSIYLPSSATIRATDARTEALKTYKEIGFLASWTSLVDSYTTKAAADVVPPQINNLLITGNMLTADVMGNNGKDIESLDVLITVSQEGGAQIVIAKEEVDEFANNKAQYAFNGQTINLNGNAVFVEILDEYDDNSGLVGVPAIVNGKKATIYIEFEIVGETLNYDVLGALPESFNGAVARLMPINTGDTINPLFQQINADGSTEFVTFTGNNFTVSSAGITIGIGSLDAGSYNLLLQATDFSGNVTTENAGAVTFSPAS
jgi:hypothetical protein